MLFLRQPSASFASASSIRFCVDHSSSLSFPVKGGELKWTTKPTSLVSFTAPMEELASYSERICEMLLSAFADCFVGPKKSWADNERRGRESPVFFLNESVVVVSE